MEASASQHRETGIEIDELLEAAVDRSESQKLQGYPVMGGSPHFVLLDQVLTVNIGEKSPHSSSRGGEKEAF